MTGNELWRALVFGLVVSAWVFVGGQLSPAMAQGCGANEKIGWTEKKGNQTIHHCKCITGYKRYAGVCVKEACAKLQFKLKNAYEGGAESGTTVGMEKITVMLQRAIDAMRSAVVKPDIKALVDNLARLVALSVAEDILYLQALHSAESEIDKFLKFYEDGPTDSKDVWTAIRNLKNFTRTIKRTKADLKLKGCIK